jgi:hypothetical protein
MAHNLSCKNDGDNFKMIIDVIPTIDEMRKDNELARIKCREAAIARARDRSKEYEKIMFKSFRQALENHKNSIYEGYSDWNRSITFNIEKLDIQEKNYYIEYVFPKFNYILTKHNFTFRYYVKENYILDKIFLCDSEYEEYNILIEIRIKIMQSKL